MISKPELLALIQAASTCRTHREALREALNDLQSLKIESLDLAHLQKDERRLLDQFAYRYTRLQDDMGAKLIPAILRALGEDIDPLPMNDRLNRMEQLGWLPSAEEWGQLRRIRNEFTHDYPETSEDRLLRLQLATVSAARISDIHDALIHQLQKRFPGRMSYAASSGSRT